LEGLCPVERFRPELNLDRAVKPLMTVTHSRHENQSAPGRHKRHFWRVLFIALAALVLLAVIGRLLLPGFVRDYVNRTLDQNPTYEGRIGDIDVHLWRGAYSIADVRMNKRTGHVPVPLFAAKKVDFSVQWDALLRGKVVGRMSITAPELNFVDASAESEGQTGADGPWLQIISDLFPFRINRAVVDRGTVHFRAFQSATPVDVYISEVNGEVDNLSNIRDELKPLVSTVRATGLVMNHAKLEFNMTLDPFSYRPTFEMALRLLGLDVVSLNDLARTYGKFDFENGWFDLVIEATAKEGLLEGYAKPLFRNLKVFSLSGDLRDENALQAFWQALVGAVSELLTNQQRDQFGTLIPFRGDLTKSTTADILATLGNVFRNAFVRAYLPSFEAGEPAGPLQFDPPRFTDPVSPGG